MGSLASRFGFGDLRNTSEVVLKYFELSHHILTRNDYRKLTNDGQWLSTRIDNPSKTPYSPAALSVVSMLETCLPRPKEDQISTMNFLYHDLQN